VGWRLNAPQRAINTRVPESQRDHAQFHLGAGEAVRKRSAPNAQMAAYAVASTTALGRSRGKLSFKLLAANQSSSGVQRETNGRHRQRPAMAESRQLGLQFARHKPNI
jgi:hypothetical protein